MTQALHLVFSNPRYNRAGYEMPSRSNQSEDLLVLVGELKGKIEGLETATKDADASRKEIYKAMEMLGAEMIRANNRIVGMSDDMTDIKRDMVPLKSLEQKITLGSQALAWIGALIFAIVGFFIRDAWTWFMAHQK